MACLHCTGVLHQATYLWWMKVVGLALFCPLSAAVAVLFSGKMLKQAFCSGTLQGVCELFVSSQVTFHLYQ